MHLFDPYAMHILTKTPDPATTSLLFGHIWHLLQRQSVLVIDDHFEHSFFGVHKKFVVLELIFDHRRHGVEEAQHLHYIVGVVAQIEFVAHSLFALQSMNTAQPFHCGSRTSLERNQART